MKILLIGDDCTEVYQFGSVAGISATSPVPVFKFEREERRAGMAYCVMKNLEALGAEVDFVATKESNTVIRLVDSRTKQYVLQQDQDSHSSIIAPGFMFNFDYDAVVIGDYDKGSVTYELVDWLRQCYPGPIFINTKKQDLSKFKDCFIVVNIQEYRLAKSLTEQLIVLDYNKSVSYNSETVLCPRVTIPDLVGADETFISALVYKYLDGKDIKDAISFAAQAMAITCQQVGVYAPTLEEITHTWQSGPMHRIANP